MKRGIDTVVIRQACGMTMRALRKKAGYAQETLALESGVDRAYMGRLERGEHTPNLDTVFKLLPRLNVGFVEFAAEMETNIRRLKHQRKAQPAAPPAVQET